MFDNWTMEAGLGLLRHVLTGAGGALITDGVLSQSQLQDGVGALITIIGILLSVYQKFENRTVPAKAPTP